jgi:hypothetical protein
MTVHYIDDYLVEKYANVVATTYAKEGREAANAVFHTVPKRYRGKVAKLAKEKMNVQRS